ncbi:ketopantoate reductase family protein [Scleromatobacter humisilvae]|uniref:2-dehydropantoate 2-reductase n=1 Tax=Scleromatobacter humisilvae TaxID=2897159 RepID=A0A9X2BXA0_9BURK|nr:2-dehydropantoate 2-reductase [Scleromatobacter humisilvae]MCK9684212.1 2-dehydropantoate 2-reductase [Scleromatobacter humisilvae]
MTTVRVAVVGAGAVGCYYGGMLARAGVPVTLIGRPVHVEAMKRDGLRLTTATSDDRIPVDASTDIAAVAGAALVLVCVKSTDTESTAAELRAHLAPDARVLSLQNGVDNAPRLQAALQRPVAATVVYVGCEMAGPGHVRHLGRGELVIPADIGVPVEDPGLTSADIVALFARAGVPVQVSDNVLGESWGKLVINCGYNAISAITDTDYGHMMARPDIAATVHGVVDECLAVAAALGITVPGDSHAGIDRIAATMPGQVSSTCQDLRRGKPTEIDHLNGHVVAEGERVGMATPLNRTLQALVKALEAKRAA